MPIEIHKLQNRRQENKDSKTPTTGQSAYKITYQYNS